MSGGQESRGALVPAANCEFVDRMMAAAWRRTGPRHTGHCIERNSTVRRPPVGQISKTCQALHAKTLRSRRNSYCDKKVFISPDTRVRFAVVTNLGGDAVDAECAETRAVDADGEVVRACRPDTGGKSRRN